MASLCGRLRNRPRGLRKMLAEQLAAETDGRRIDDRHHLFDIAGQQRIEQGLVGILQAAQEHVSLDVAAEAAKGVEPAFHLVVEFGDVRRQQAMQVERVALGLGEAVPLLSKRIVEEFIAAERGFDDVRRSYYSLIPVTRPRDTIIVTPHRPFNGTAALRDRHGL